MLGLVRRRARLVRRREGGALWASGLQRTNINIAQSIPIFSRSDSNSLPAVPFGSVPFRAVRACVRSKFGAQQPSGEARLARSFVSAPHWRAGRHSRKSIISDAVRRQRLPRALSQPRSVRSHSPRNRGHLAPGRPRPPSLALRWAFEFWRGRGSKTGQAEQGQSLSRYKHSCYK